MTARALILTAGCLDTNGNSLDIDGRMPIDARPGAAVSAPFQRTLGNTPLKLKQYPFDVG